MMPNPSRPQWELPTLSGAYVVSLLPDGSGLVLDSWGERPAVPIDRWDEPERVGSYGTFNDFAPLEYASAGQRHVTFSELLVERDDARTGATWRARTDEIAFTSDAVGARLAVPFVDETGELALTLRVVTSATHDVVRRSVTVAYSGDSLVRLPRVFSGGWNVPVGQHASIGYLAGTWANEFNQRSVALKWGSFSIGSRQGVTGLAFSPVVSITSIPDPDSLPRNPDAAYGVALDWSGSWRLQAESLPIGQSIRVSAGIDDDTTTITLAGGESFTTPDTLGVWSPSGLDGLRRAWHRFQRTELARSLDPYHHPVVYNSWEATHFDVNLDHQRRLAAVAKEIGTEVFVLDDGWFAGRTSDRAGLGDWHSDEAKFPGGIAELARSVTELGMRFGIWIEPEAVNPDSELYRTHPDWIYRAEGREPMTIRNQYVLDFGRPEVLDWVEGTLRSLLSSAPISYLKWDMNRPVTDGGRPGDLHGTEWSVQHTRGYYRVLRMLRAEFPHVTVEACASGGGRIDNAVLALSDVVWTSDQVGPWDRLLIQHGFLSAYPAHVMSSWAADAPGHRERRATSLGFRFVVAMAGALGIGADLLRWSDEQIGQAKDLVALYTDIRRIVHHGEVEIHGKPGDIGYALEYSAPSSDDPIVILVYDRDRDMNRDRERVRVFARTLVPGRSYAVRGTGMVVTAADAGTTGIPVPFAVADDADVLILDPVA